ncbi:MAG: TetR/AcrR family transcriptional regulator [Lachnospiraceae bacterium]
MDRRIEKTRASIRDAYFSLLEKNQSNKVTISEIARQANIDRKTFYLHYNEPEDIMREFAQEKINEIMEYLKKSYVADQPTDVKILFDVLNRILEENMVFFRFIALNPKYDYFFDQLKELFVSILINDYEKFFDFSDIDFRIYADYFVSGILSVYMRWIRENLPLSLEDLAQRVSTAAFGGLQCLLPHQLHSIE